MPAETYDQLNDRVMGLYQVQDFAGALDLLEREGEAFPEQAPNILYLRSCMAARLGRNEQSLALIRQALDRGIWYGEQVMRRSPSWEPLQGIPEFERLVDECKVLQDREVSGARLLVLEPGEGCSEAQPCPAVVALHGNMMNGETALEGWRPVTSRGWLLASVQSSQAGMSGAFVWDDADVALRDVAEQYSALTAGYSIDRDHVILAGFSLGGETALLAALKGTIPVEGFMLLGPGGQRVDEPESLLPLIEQASLRGLRGYIFVGENDNLIEHDALHTLAGLLNEHGIPCGLEAVPGIRHEYPADFGPYIDRALAFLAPRG